MTEQRAVLVTGARGGIGAAIVARLEVDGWGVHGVDVEDGDLATREGNRRVVEEAIDRFGRLDAVVPNAGLQYVAPIRAFPEDQWDKLIAVLLTSPFLLARYAWDALAASGDGRICVIASAHALTASPFKAGYVSAKHGVLGLVKTLALEGAEVGISATAVCPAYVRTPLVEGQISDQARASSLDEERGARERAPRTAGGEAAARTFGGRGCRSVPARSGRPRHHRRAGADRPRLDSPLAGCRRRGRSEQGRGVGMHRGSAQSSGRMDLDGGAPEWLFVVLGLESGPRAHSSAGERSLHTREVPGSIPGAPTGFSLQIGIFLRPGPLRDHEPTWLESYLQGFLSKKTDRQ